MGWLLVVCMGLLWGSPAVATDGFARRWDDLARRLEGVLAAVEEKKELPDSSLNPFKKTDKDADQEIDRLIEKAVEILEISQFTSLKAQINHCLHNISTLREKAARYKTARLMAPEDTNWRVWKKDREDYEELIRECHRAISENETEIKALKTRLQEQLRQSGVNVTEKELDTLIFSVTGDDDIQLVAVFENIKTITGQLRTLVSGSSTDMTLAQKYYGMHLVLVKILLHLQNTYAQRIQADYLPKIDGIIRETDQLMQQTRTRLASAEGPHKKIYKSNLQAQKLTQKTARLYRYYLEKNQSRIKASIQRVQAERQVADNTYQTVRSAAALMGVMAESERFYNALSKLQMPELIQFENDAVKAEFVNLSRQMTDLP